MTEIHQVKCDKCGKIGNLRNGTYGNWKLPLFWKNIEKNWLVDLDLCSKCVRELKEHSREFFK